MKKLALVCLCLILTGCTAVRINTADIDNTIDVVLSKNNKLYNRIGKGYKYYLPRGMTYIDTNDLNDKLYSNGVYYYLYVDAISYYYKSEIDFAEEKDIYYYRKIDGKKKGYAKIVKEDDKYHVTFVYNYAKIEAIVNKNQIEEVILNSSYILSTVKFNEKVIKIMLNEDYFTNKEERYDVFTRRETEDYFLVEETDENNRGD